METSQLRTVLWLRWRLTKNQWARGGQVSAALSLAVVAIVSVVGLAGSLAGVLLGVLRLADEPPQTLLLVWDGLIFAFLFFWIIGVVSNIQRSETIDVGKMLHLPVSLRGLFLINFLASHLTLSIALFLPGMLGLVLGLALGRGVAMLAMVPLILGCLFMVTAWTYCLRGWLVTLMVNPRRRRAVIAIVTFLFILICQLPNLATHLMARQKRQARPPVAAAPNESQTQQSPTASERTGRNQWVDTAHQVVPFLWPAQGALCLAQGRIGPALWGSVGTLLLGSLGLARAYRTTIRFYAGVGTKKRRRQKPRRPRQVSPSAGSLLEMRLPGVPGEAAALALASFRSMMRAPEIKMMLGSNVLILFFLGMMTLFGETKRPDPAFTPLVVTLAVAATYFGLLQLMFNQFGYDRNGFRILVLVPAQRTRILLGKNIALIPFALGIGGTLLLLVKFLVAAPFLIVMAGTLQLFTAFLSVSFLGNLLSILLPYRIAPGSMKPTKTAATVTFLIFLSHMLFPLAMVPLFLVPLLGWLLGRLGWLSPGVTHCLLAGLILGVFVLLYRISLPPLGRLLGRREQKILAVVTQEVE